MNTNPEKIKCAKCGSYQLTANKVGFSGAKALGGAVITGGIGLLAGTIGSSKIKITCLTCGHHFKPGQDLASKNAKSLKHRKELDSPVFKALSTLLIVMLAFLALIMLLMFVM
jgi:ribosomal protein S27E